MKEDHSNILAKLLTTMLDQVSDGIVAFDKNWNYIYVNQKAAQLLNRPTPAALIGKHVWTEFPESLDLPIYRSCLKALETQEVIYIEQFNPVLGRWYENRLYPSPDGIISYFTDITERKQNEIQIREQHELLEVTLKAARVGLWDWDLKTNTVHFSSEWKHQIGHEDDEITNDFKEWESRVHPDDLAKALKIVQEFLRSPYPDYRNEFRFRHKDGTYRWILAQADLVYDEAGEPIRMLGSHIDITDRKHSETMLFKQRQQLALIYDTVADVIFYLTVEDGNKFRFVSVNQAFLNSTELKSEDVVGKLIQQVIPEPSLTFVLEKYELAIRTKEIMRWEETTTYPIGTVTGEVSIAPIFDDEGHCTHLVGSVHDITTRKQAENVIKVSEERLRLSTELVNVAVWEYDLVENEMRRSTNHDSLYGLEPQEIWQIETFLNSTHPDDREMSNQIVQGAIVADGYDKYSFDFRVIWPDSSIHWLSVTGEVVQRDTNNVAQLVRGAITDITARKQSEDMLKASEQLFSTAFQVGPTGMTITRISDGKFIDANESFCKMFEYDRDEVIGRTSTELNMWTLEERQKLIQQQLETGGLHNFELVAQSKSRRSINILFSSKEMHINDEHCHLTTMIDISDRKKIENELEMSEKRFRTLIEKSSDAIVLSDSQGNILYHSPSVVTLSGYTEEEYRQTAPASRIHPDDMAKFPENFKWLLEHPGETLEFESRSRHKDGTWHIMENKSRNLLHDPAVEAIITNFHDITERKQAEEALEASEQRFRTLIEKSQDFIILLDANIKPVYVSPSTLTVLGYTSEEFIQHGRAGLVHPEDTKLLGELYSQLLEYPDETLESEIRAHHKDGSWRTLRWMARNLLQDPDINAIVANLSDITERKQAEQALYESEKLFSDTFHMSPIGMVITHGTDYKIIDINETWANMLEFNRDEVIGQTSTRLNLLATEERKRAMQQLLESDKLFNFEIEVQSKSGKILNMLISSKKLIIKGETCYLTTLIDVTERKQAEKALQESEQKYRTLVEHAADGIFLSDSQGFYIDVNTSGCRMLGYSRTELIGKHLSELVAPENLAAQPLQLDKLKAGNSFISERMLKHKAGTSIPVEISAKMLPNGDLLGIVRDIRERKQAAEKLTYERNILRTLIDSLPHQIYQKDLQGRFVLANRHVVQVWGLSTEAEMIGKTDFDLKGTNVDSSIMTYFFKQEQQIMQSGRPLQMEEIEINDPQSNQNSYLLINKIPLRDANDSVSGIIGINFDITELKNAENKLKHHSTRLQVLHEIDRAILNAKTTREVASVAVSRVQELIPSIRVGVASYDLEKSLAFVLATSNKSTGLPEGSYVALAPNQVIQETLRQPSLTVTDDITTVAHLSPVLQDLVKQGVRAHIWVPLVVQNKLIGSFTIMADKVGAFNEDHIEIAQEIGDQLAVALNQTQLFEQIHASHQRLQEVSRQLIDAQEAERRRVALELHDELGQGLMILKLDLELIQEQILQEDEVLQQRVQESIDLTNRVTEQMRNLAMELRPSLLDDLGLYSALRGYIERYVQRTNIETELNIIGQEVRLDSVTESAIFRCVQEALTNTARYAQAQHVRIDLEVKATFINVGIIDNGIGFDPNEESKIDKVGGTGLSGMRERLALLDGKMKLVSSPGRGTQIHVEIPRSV